jgi:hypothetical protein
MRRSRTDKSQNFQVLPIRRSSCNDESHRNQTINRQGAYIISRRPSHGQFARRCCPQAFLRIFSELTYIRTVGNSTLVKKKLYTLPNHTITIVSCRNGPCRGCLLIYRSLFYIVWFLWWIPTFSLWLSALYYFGSASGFPLQRKQASLVVNYRSYHVNFGLSGNIFNSAGSASERGRGKKCIWKTFKF